MTTEHPWIKAKKYIDLHKTRVDLDRSIHEYKLGLSHRLVITEAVCDAIDGFCEETCLYQRTHAIFNNYTGKTRYSYEISCASHQGVILFDKTICPYCGERVVERFDILKEEGV